jgi:hypothetical protein
MALAAPQQDFVVRVGAACKAILDLQGSVTQLDILYNGTPDWDTLITDEEINGVPSFAAIGLTAQDVADALYQLNQIRNQVNTGNLPAMVLLSQAA